MGRGIAGALEGHLDPRLNLVILSGERTTLRCSSSASFISHASPCNMRPSCQQKNPSTWRTRLSRAGQCAHKLTEAGTRVNPGTLVRGNTDSELVVSETDLRPIEP